MRGLKRIFEDRRIVPGAAALAVGLTGAAVGYGAYKAAGAAYDYIYGDDEILTPAASAPSVVNTNYVPDENDAMISDLLYDDIIDDCGGLEDFLEVV